MPSTKSLAMRRAIVSMSALHEPKYQISRQLISCLSTLAISILGLHSTFFRCPAISRKEQLSRCMILN
jgi:hypothetical protein